MQFCKNYTTVGISIEVKFLNKSNKQSINSDKIRINNTSLQIIFISIYGSHITNYIFNILHG